MDLGVRCKKLELDLSSENSYAKLFSTAKSKLGDRLILINNATYSTQKK